MRGAEDVRDESEIYHTLFETDVRQMFTQIKVNVIAVRRRYTIHGGAKI